MPAFDARGKQVSCNRRRWMESRIAFGIAGPGDWALGLCIGNFAEHALRRCGDLAWLGAAGRHNFLCWFSPMASAAGHGTLPSPLLPGCSNARATPFRATQHD